MENKKVVLITGGTSGIGFGTIEYLLEQGNYEIISVSRGNKNIALAKEKLGEKANQVIFLQGDVSKEAKEKHSYRCHSRYLTCYSYNSTSCVSKW